MRHHARFAAFALAVVAILGCETDSRTHDTDDGGILLSISQFTGLPTRISASAFTASIGSISVQSIIKNPGQGSSQLMTVEMDSYECTYSRDDLGTRVPPRLKNFITGSVAAGGTFTLTNPPFMRIDQFEQQPLKDLRELGFDPETRSSVIRLKVGIQFFGRTLSGDVVQSEPGFFTLEVVP
jgi:hypothetical protein